MKTLEKKTAKNFRFSPDVLARLSSERSRTGKTETAIIEDALLWRRMFGDEAATSKARRRRIVYPMPAAVDLLREAAESGSELPLPWQPRRRVLRGLRSALGWPVWQKDVTRHTAASYWLAATDDAALVASQLGHSVMMLEEHYKAAVSREDARLFWGSCVTR